MPWTIPDHEASAIEAIARGVISGNPDHLADVPEPTQSAEHQARVSSLSLLNKLGGGAAVITQRWVPGLYQPPVEPPVGPPMEPPSTGDFLAAPRRDPMTVIGGSDIELTNFSIVGGDVGSPQHIAMTLVDINGAYIHDIDFANVIGGIYLYNCTDVVIEDVRGRNVGDGSIGSGHSNYVQFAESHGGAIRRCTFVGGRSEDMVSTWHSGDYVFEDNHLEGYLYDTPTARAWTSASGTGFIVSDGEGSPNNGNVTVRNNVILNPGQVGIQHIDGPNLKTYGNIVIGEQNRLSNQPYSSWEGHPQAEVYGNRHRWYKPDGTPTNGWFHVPVDFHDNVWDDSLNINDYRVEL